MADIEKALEIYYEAVKQGIVDVNAEAQQQMAATVKEYEGEINSITRQINEKNQKIKELQKQKVGATKEEKKELSLLIAEERAQVGVLRQCVKSIKGQRTAIKSASKEYVEASELINAGLKQSLDSLDDTGEKISLNYEMWNETEGELADSTDKMLKKEQKLNEELELQAEKINQVKVAYEKMSELYGENSEESEKLALQLLEEEVAYEKIKSAIENLAGNKEYTDDGSLLDKRFQLWYESGDEDSEEIREGKKSYLEMKLESQANKILETENSLKKMREAYGENSQASRELEKQLLSECIAYEKINDEIEKLNIQHDYTREEISDIIYDMNAFLKDNYQKLKEAGFSDETIYEAAIGKSGYSQYVDSISGDKEKFKTEAQVQAEKTIEQLNETFTGISGDFAKSVETSVASLLNGVAGVVSSVVATTTGALDQAVNNVYNTSYNNSYTISGLSSGSISDGIKEIVDHEAIKKARGIGNEISI